MSEAVWLNPQNLGSFLVNLLAIAGGFLIGYVGMYYGLPAFLNTATARLVKLPNWLRQIMSLLSGVLVAWLISLLVFGAGGAGWGLGGSGTSDGKSTGKDGGTNGVSTVRETAPEGKGTGRDGDRPDDATLAVEVLNYAGGQFIADSHRYRLKGDPELKTLEEIEAAVDQQLRESSGKGQLKQLEIWVYLNSPDKDTLPVKELLNLGKRKGLTTTVTLPQTQSP